MGEIGEELCIRNYNIAKVVSRFYSFSSLPKYTHEWRIHVLWWEKKTQPQDNLIRFRLRLCSNNFNQKGSSLEFLFLTNPDNSTRREGLLSSFYLICCFAFSFFWHPIYLFLNFFWYLTGFYGCLAHTIQDLSDHVCTSTPWETFKLFLKWAF